MRAQRFFCGAPDNFRGVASGCSLFRGKNVRKKRGGDAESVRCSEFRGGRFSEVANVLHKRDFQSVIATLSAVGSVSASRSVRSGRFYCTTKIQCKFSNTTKIRISHQLNLHLLDNRQSRP